MSAIMLAPSPFRVPHSAFEKPPGLRPALALCLRKTAHAALAEF